MKIFSLLTPQENFSNITGQMPSVTHIMYICTISKIMKELRKNYVLQVKSTHRPHQNDRSISYFQSKTPKTKLDGPELAV